MRRAVQLGLPAETVSTTTVERRPALWYRKLRERCDETGATRHLGCSAILLKLFKYCDVDMKSRPKMLNRFCLLIVSLPTTELAKRSWQLAIRVSIYSMPPNVSVLLHAIWSLNISSKTIRISFR